MTLGLTVDTTMSRTEVCAMLAIYGHYGNVGGVKYTDLYEKAMEIAGSVDGLTDVTRPAKRKRNSVLPSVERWDTLPTLNRLQRLLKTNTPYGHQIL